MNSFEKIKKACDAIGVPAYPDFNEQNEDTYAVYNFAAETPMNFGDDEPNAVIADMQLHLYLPANTNFFDLHMKMKKSIFSSGFTYPRVALNQVEDDKYRHIVYEFEDDCDEI